MAAFNQKQKTATWVLIGVVVVVFISLLYVVKAMTMNGPVTNTRSRASENEVSEPSDEIFSLEKELSSLEYDTAQGEANQIRDLR